MLHFIFLTLISISFGFNNEYDFIQAIPKTEDQMETLKIILTNSEYDVWNSSKKLGDPWAFMVQPSQSKKIKTILTMNDIMYQNLSNNFPKKNHILEDIKKLDIEEQTTAFPNLTRSRREVEDCRFGLSMRKYHSYPTMVKYMAMSARKYSKKVSFLTIGRTGQGRLIQGVKIAGPRAEIGILVDAGIHAREWLSPAVAAHVMAELIENPKFAFMSERIIWYIFPTLNPDGYAYSRTRGGRKWRKNRTKGRRCDGVDLNRNFDLDWGDPSGCSHDECNEVYAGPKAFSEPESSALAKFAYDRRDHLKLYVSIHTHGGDILYPWSYKWKKIHNWRQMKGLAERVASAIYKGGGTKYTIGTNPDLLYLASGTSMDWMAGIGIPLSYTIELPGYGYAFYSPPTYIRRTAHDIFNGMKVFHQYVEQKYARN